MNALKKLQQAGDTKPYHGFKTLEIGYHKVFGFRFVKNKYEKKDENGEHSKTILVELKDQIVFLPRYFMDYLKEKDIAELNSNCIDDENVFLYFGGQKKDSR